MRGCSVPDLQESCCNKSKFNNTFNSNPNFPSFPSQQNISGHPWTSQSCTDVFPTYLRCDPVTHRVFQAQTAKQVYSSFVNIVMFFLPIILMSICYSMIVAKLYCTKSPGERDGGVPPQARAKRKVVTLVLVVLATFVICWSPHQVPMAHAILLTGSQVTTKQAKYKY